MPRAAKNNPTERIGRLLDEMEEMAKLIKFHIPHLFPRLVAFESEKVRRSLTYTRTINQMRARKKFNTAMDKPFMEAKAEAKMFQEDAMREAEEMTRGSAPIIDPKPMSDEDIEIAVAAVKREEAQALIERGSSFKSLDTYKPDIKNLFGKTKTKESENGS